VFLTTIPIDNFSFKDALVMSGMTFSRRVFEDLFLVAGTMQQSDMELRSTSKASQTEGDRNGNVCMMDEAMLSMLGLDPSNSTSSQRNFSIKRKS
jgi:hypothetical protein